MKTKTLMVVLLAAMGCSSGGGESNATSGGSSAASSGSAGTSSGGAANSSGANSSSGANGSGSGSPSLYSFPAGAQVGGLAVMADAGVFFVCSSADGKVWTGSPRIPVGGELPLFGDFTDAGLNGCSSLAAGPAGQVVSVGFAGAQLLDLQQGVVTSLTTPASDAGAGAFGALLSYAAVTPSGDAYLTSASEKALYHFKVGTATTLDRLPFEGSFPVYASTSQGFINAQGIAVTADGTHLVLTQLIEKTLYQIDLTASPLTAVLVDTGSDNGSGEGLALAADGTLFEALTDAQQVAKIHLAADLSSATYLSKLGASVGVGIGANSVAVLGRELLVLNSGQSLTAGGGFGAMGDGGGGNFAGDGGRPGDGGLPGGGRPLSDGGVPPTLAVIPF